MKAYCSIFSIFILLLVSGCDVYNQQPKILTSTTAIRTITSLPITAEATTLPPETITPTQTPTWTLQPTLLPEKAKQLSLELLQNNANCRLPCWWGITPGQTTWEDTQKLFLQFYSRPYIRKLEGESFIGSFSIPVYEEISQNYPEYFFTVRNGIVEEILVDPGNVSNYQFSALLESLGQPSEVWIRTYANAHSHSQDDTVPFGIVSFYPKEGIVVSCYPDAERQGDQIRTCLKETMISELGLWNPTENISSIEASALFEIDSEAWPFKSLKEVTGLDEATFYKKYTSGEGNFCLETPAELWWSLP